MPIFLQSCNWSARLPALLIGAGNSTTRSFHQTPAALCSCWNTGRFSWAFLWRVLSITSGRSKTSSWLQNRAVTVLASFLSTSSWHTQKAGVRGPFFWKCVNQTCRPALCTKTLASSQLAGGQGISGIQLRTQSSTAFFFGKLHCFQCNFLLLENVFCSIDLWNLGLMQHRPC